MQQQQPKGYIHVIVGPMFSGKTTELQRLIDRQGLAGKTVVYVRHAQSEADNTDPRRSTIYMNMASNIEMKMVSSFTIDRDMGDWMAKRFDVIAIDEGQFFGGLAADGWANHWANRGKIVLIAALNSDSMQRPYETTVELMGMAEKITRLNAICSRCAKSAAFTWRIGSGELATESRLFQHNHCSFEHSNAGFVTGKSTDFEPICRACICAYATTTHLMFLFFSGEERRRRQW